METKEKIFADGLIFQDPKEKAPDFIKFDLVVNVEKFTEFLKKNMEYISPKGWLTITAKESKKGGIYFELNTWKPTPKTENKDSMTTVQPDGSEPLDTSEIPF